MGFGTSSSAATMPMTMECASKYGCRDSLVKFVIPLGTNINRDGAALYEASSVIFIAQARCTPSVQGCKDLRVYLTVRTAPLCTRPSASSSSRRRAALPVWL